MLKVLSITLVLLSVGCSQSPRKSVQDDRSSKKSDDSKASVVNGGSETTGLAENSNVNVSETSSEEQKLIVCPVELPLPTVEGGETSGEPSETEVSISSDERVEVLVNELISFVLLTKPLSFVAEQLNFTFSLWKEMKDDGNRLWVCKELGTSIFHVSHMAAANLLSEEAKLQKDDFQETIDELMPLFCSEEYK